MNHTDVTLANSYSLSNTEKDPGLFTSEESGYLNQTESHYVSSDSSLLELATTSRFTRKVTPKVTPKVTIDKIVGTSVKSVSDDSPLSTPDYTKDDVSESAISWATSDDEKVSPPSWIDTSLLFTNDSWGNATNSTEFEQYRYRN